MQTYVKRPIAVEAVQFDDIPANDPPGVFRRPEDNTPYVVTIHDQKAFLSPGDWIIAESDGVHYYPCKPEEFNKFYSQVEPAPETAAEYVSPAPSEKLRGTGRTTAKILHAIAYALQQPDQNIKLLDHWDAPEGTEVHTKFLLGYAQTIIEKLGLTIDTIVEEGQIFVRSPITRMRSDETKETSNE